MPDQPDFSGFITREGIPTGDNRIVPDEVIDRDLQWIDGPRGPILGKANITEDADGYTVNFELNNECRRLLGIPIEATGVEAPRPTRIEIRGPIKAVSGATRTQLAIARGTRFLDKVHKPEWYYVLVEKKLKTVGTTATVIYNADINFGEEGVVEIIGRSSNGL